MLVPPTAPPIVFTMAPTSPVVLNTSFPLSFTVPPSHNGSALTCLARGRPTPEIKWLDQNSQPLTSSYQSCEFGVVSVVLSLNNNLDLRSVRCVATNIFDEESRAVQLYVGKAVAPSLSLSSPSETDGATRVSFSLRVLTSDCPQSDVSLFVLVNIISSLQNVYIQLSNYYISRGNCNNNWVNKWKHINDKKC